MKLTKAELTILLTLALVQFTHIMDFMIMMPLGPQLMRLFNLKTNQFSLIVSVFTFAAGISGFLGAFFIDRFDRKKALIINYCGFVVGTFVCAMAPTYYTLLAARMFTGIFGGLASALLYSIIGDTIAPEKRGRAMGVIMASFSLASIFGVPFGLQMANWFSWHASFYFIGFMGIVVIVFAYKFIPSLTAHLENPKPFNPIQTITDAIDTKSKRMALLLTMCLIFGQFTIIPFISPYMVANVGFAETQLPLIYLVGGICSMISAPLIGKLADSFGKKKTFYIFAPLSILAIIAVSNMPRVELWVALTILSMFFICSGGRMIPAQALLTGVAKPENRASFMSFNSFVQQISTAIAAYIAGFLVTKSNSGELLNYHHAGYVALAFSLATIFIIGKIKVDGE